MDAPTTFLCTVMHPRLFPGLITNPGKPFRVEMLIEVGIEELIIRAPAPSAKGRVMGPEPLAGISQVTIERVDGGARRLEILRRSLKRMALIGGIVLAFALFIRAYSPGARVLMALAVALHRPDQFPVQWGFLEASRRSYAFTSCQPEIVGLSSWKFSLLGNRNYMRRCLLPVCDSKLLTQIINCEPIDGTGDVIEVPILD